ncbi:MAG: SpoIID/LytB domain-containing protein [Lachnospiraceae bacterium]|nr:SpoIID/LytB domain-containing protein [Lachnospiraceae bacterium]
MVRKSGWILLLAALLLAITGRTLRRREQEVVWEQAGVTKEEALEAECCGEAETNEEREENESGAAESSTEDTEQGAEGESESFSSEVSEEDTAGAPASWGSLTVSAASPSSYRLAAFEQDDGELKIRVLIGTSDYEGLLHDVVRVTSDRDFIMEGTDQDAVYPAGTELDVTPSFLEQYGGQVIFSGEGSFYLLNVKRSCGTPAYPGTIECTNYSGQIGVVNELSLEAYLERVVPAEMPDSYGEEALKAQAVCARSYSCSQMLEGKYTAYGADVDDSTASQVYNNQAWSETAAEAVAATVGQVLVSGGEIVEAYYYSTSCGYGADVSVWSDSVTCSYVTASSLTAGREVLDLSEEVSFRQFLESSQDSWDSDSPWFRWTADRSVNELTELVNTWLTGQNRNPVGTVTDLVVTERLENGAVSALALHGTEGKTEIIGTDSIRDLLGSSALSVTRQDGSEQAGLSLLPSAFFYVEETDEGWRFRGGGFGHGVGLSQDGADGMAEQGYSYSSILSFFYEGVSLCQLYHET